MKDVGRKGGSPTPLSEKNQSPTYRCSISDVAALCFIMHAILNQTNR